MMLKKILFHLLWLIILQLKISAQIWDYSYTHFGKEDGLPSNVIYCTASDKDGFLWIGTDAGLVKFDGSHYKIFTTNDGLPSNDIFNAYCDSKNRIWVNGMSPDIAFIKNNKIYNKNNTPYLSIIKLGSQFVKTYEDENGTIFLVSNHFSIYQIDTSNKVFHLDLSNQTGVVRKYIKMGNKSLYITDSIMILLDKKNKVEKISPLSKLINITSIAKIGDTIYYCVINTKGIKKLNINEIRKYKIVSLTHTNSLITCNDELYLIDNKGIFFIDKRNKILLNNIKYLSDYSISNFSKDTLNNYWISTVGNGLMKLNSKTNRIYKNKSTQKNNLYSICITDKNIFLGNSNGLLTKINKNNHFDIKMKDIDSKSYHSIRILKISEINSNSILISTDYGMFIYNILTQNITNICPNTAFKNHYIKGNTIFGLLTNGYVTIDLNTLKIERFYYFKRTYASINFEQDNILGTEEGLFTYDNKILLEYKLNKPMNSRVMDMITQDSMLILATINSGIYFIKNHTIIRQINTKNGLSSNNCFKIIPYKNDYYIATNNGISIYNYQKNSIHNLYESDGLSSNTVNDIAIDKDTLYAATENGLSIISIANIDTNKHFILFNKPTIIGKDTLWTSDSLFTTHTNLPFSFTLNSLSYNTKGIVDYYYSINQNDFIATKDQVINIQFPTPGKYDFEAYAKDKNGNVSNIVKLKINVVPYFHQTIWFKLLIAFLAIVFLYFLFKYLLNRANKKELAKRELDTKIHNLELSAWRSKINPHFLFNSLNVLHYLFLDNDEEKANTYMQNFSSVLRKTIDNSGKLLNTILDECAYIEEYMKLETIKRKNNFSFKIDYQKEVLKKYFIPSMLLQPVLENSLKHGIRENLNGEINIHFYEKESQLICEVTDNGRGFENYNTIHTEHKSVGIELIEDKIKIIEKIIHQKILFSFNTRFNEKNESIGSITTFIFPIITKDITND